MNKFYQIYFHESQLDKLDYTPYFNNANVFFENQVIVDLKDEMNGCDYFAVLSHSLRDKCTVSKRWVGNINNTSSLEFTPERFEVFLHKHKPDAMSFQRHPSHDPVTLADKYHPNFSSYFRDIMGAIGYNWKPTVFENVFYCNYQAVKPEIYKDYVDRVLKPAMNYMLLVPELMRNSNYPKQLPKELCDRFGIDWYPYHPFLCERLFSFYAHINKLKCLHY